MFSLDRSSNWHFIFCVESIDVVQPCSCKWCWIWIVMRQKAELRSLVYGPMSFSSLKAELNLTKFYMLSGCFAAGKGFLNMFGFQLCLSKRGQCTKIKQNHQIQFCDTLFSDIQHHLVLLNFVEETKGCKYVFWQTLNFWWDVHWCRIICRQITHYVHQVLTKLTKKMGHKWRKIWVLLWSQK